MGNVGASEMKECVCVCNRSERERVRVHDECEHLWVRLSVGVWHKRVCGCFFICDFLSLLE